MWKRTKEKPPLGKITEDKLQDSFLGLAMLVNSKFKTDHFYFFVLSLPYPYSSRSS